MAHTQHHFIHGDVDTFAFTGSRALCSAASAAVVAVRPEKYRRYTGRQALAGQHHRSESGTTEGLGDGVIGRKIGVLLGAY